MNYNVEIHANFGRELKSLAKKYPSIKNDIINVVQNIEKELTQADDLGYGFKKIRLNIKSKGKGASGGARIISLETIISFDKTNVFLLSIYNKGDFDTIDLSILKKNLDL